MAAFASNAASIALEVHLRNGLLTQELVQLMQTWWHSGPNVNASVRIGADDVTECENLARYLIRATPFSMSKIRSDTAV